MLSKTSTIIYIYSNQMDNKLKKEVIHIPVTVSIGELTKGVFSVIFLVKDEAKLWNENQIQE